MHLIVSIPDDRKGEQLVLLTTHKEAKREEINAFFKEKGLPQLAQPRKIIIKDALPLLGTGKADYQAAKAIAMAETP